MKVLVIGGGGREHALVWKIARSPLVERVWCAPGNAGIAKLAECVDLAPDNLEGLAEFARQNAVDLTVVGPEGPLCQGIVNLFVDRKLRIFGPSREAAELEGSKVFCKGLLRRYGIPTPNFRTFNQAKAALAFVRSAQYPLVLKADGLASGKGVVICQTENEAVVAIEGMMEKKVFGNAGNQIVVEEFLNGEEATLMALTDGRSIVTLESTRDHKRVYDGDRGPNTGGMGSYSPAPVPERDMTRIIREILVPTVHAMNREKRRFRGLLYAGIMLTKSGPKVLEFNARFGDPETQSLVVRLKSDLVPLLIATIEDRLDEADIDWDPNPSVCVTLTSGGYPGAFETGYEITGTEEADKIPGVVSFHAGTQTRDGKLVTSGGRVLGVTATGPDLIAARRSAYEAAQKISFRGVHYRKDIASRAAERVPSV